MTKNWTLILKSAFGNLGNFGSLDFNLDWLSQQNGGQFDPQLFGNYREPQNNVLANPTFDDSFFNDAFDVDFLAPFNAPTVTSPEPAKVGICEEIDARKETEDTIVAAPNGKLLTCNNIWSVTFSAGPFRKTQLTRLIGNNYKAAPKCKLVISILTVSALTCRKRPNAEAPVPLLTKRTSRPS